MQENNDTGEYYSLPEVENDKNTGWKVKFHHFLMGKYFVPLIIVLVAIIGFALGRVSVIQSQKQPVRVIDNSNNTISPPYSKGETTTGEVKGASTQSTSSGQVVASKTGKKYHLPWCAGAKQISEKNKIYFDSIEAARAAGYTPASNCKGLK